MAGSIRNLSLGSTRLPSRLVVDSNIVIDWLLAISGVSESTVSTLQQHRSSRLVYRLNAERAAGLVTSTGLNEIFHFVLKSRFRAEIPNYRDDLVGRYPNVARHGWDHLFKARSDLIDRYAVDLDRVRRAMLGNRLFVLQPEDLGPIPSGRTLDDELVRTMARYRLDSNDASILVEAHRAGVTAVASSDPDFRRTQLDFDVYTWT